MLKVAYLANRFPTAVEPYVGEEIAALRRFGVQVIAGSVAQARADGESQSAPEIVLRPIQARTLTRAVWLCVRRWHKISDVISSALFRGTEGPVLRVKALLHTVLGAGYAVLLEGQAVEHIHVHHGFSAAWIAMVAAKLLGVEFSMTLHGSDLLLHRAFLDVKLRNCKFCLTVSEYNRRFLATHYPQIDPAKVMVARLGVEIPQAWMKLGDPRTQAEMFRMLAVGRLHAVKDHAFLVRACHQLHAQGMEFHCDIAGEGPERSRLESLIRGLGLENRVRLLGHTSREETDSLYKQADLVVLTSRSEGIPLVLMEAMARGRLVLAPAITGIPELVVAGKTGFLYEAGSMTDFLAQVTKICTLLGKPPFLPRTMAENLSASSYARTRESVRRLDWIRHAARVQVRRNFNRQTNLQSFTDLFVARVSPHQGEDLPHASSLLQQI
jgi:colanic acid/amylovoran biosynthesis glycosyltransferase